MTKPNGTAEPEARSACRHSMPVMFGMFQSDSTRSGCSDDDLRQRVGAVLGLDDVVVVVPGLAQGADDDLPHDAAVVGDQDLHSGPPFGLSVVQCWGHGQGRQGALHGDGERLAAPQDVDAAQVGRVAHGRGGPDLGQAERATGRAGPP